MLLSAVILGLVSSLHCVGMCGPIALMLPVDRTSPAKKALQIIIYQLGRLSSYGTLGLIFGFLGRSLYLAGIQQQLSVVIGFIIIRSEEHTSELQSRENLVCRLLLE